MIAEPLYFCGIGPVYNLSRNAYYAFFHIQAMKCPSEVKGVKFKFPSKTVGEKMHLS